MEKWKVKGIVTDEPKSKQQTEQAVLDKAVEKGEIEPEAAGKKDNDVIKIDLDKLKNKEKDASEEIRKAAQLEELDLAFCSFHFE